MLSFYLKASFSESEIGACQELPVPGFLGIQAALAYTSDRNCPDPPGSSGLFPRSLAQFPGSGDPGNSARRLVLILRKV